MKRSSNTMEVDEAELEEPISKLQKPIPGSSNNNCKDDAVASCDKVATSGLLSLSDTLLTKIVAMVIEDESRLYYDDMEQLHHISAVCRRLRDCVVTAIRLVWDWRQVFLEGNETSFYVNGIDVVNADDGKIDEELVRHLLRFCWPNSLEIDMWDKWGTADTFGEIMALLPVPQSPIHHLEIDLSSSIPLDTLPFSLTALQLYFSSPPTTTFLESIGQLRGLQALQVNGDCDSIMNGAMVKALFAGVRQLWKLDRFGLGHCFGSGEVRATFLNYLPRVPGSICFDGGDFNYQHFGAQVKAGGYGNVFSVCCIQYHDETFIATMSVLIEAFPNCRYFSAECFDPNGVLTRQKVENIGAHLLTKCLNVRPEGDLNLVLPRCNGMGTQMICSFEERSVNLNMIGPISDDEGKMLCSFYHYSGQP